MRLSEARRAVAAATYVASAHDLSVDDVVVLRNSNKLAARLLPCDVFARVAPSAQQGAAFEVELALQLADAGSPVAALEPRVEPCVYEHDGFLVTLWTYYEPLPDREVSASDYADALARLHAGMRTVTLATPHFTDRVEEAEGLVASGAPRLTDTDRQILANMLRNKLRACVDRGAAEQVLHGEPHPGNLLNTKSGLRFIDLETSCRGPVEFDLAHVPENVVEYYPNVDHGLLHECRGLVLAMVAAWRWDTGDELPNGRRAARELVSALREGPPWPTLDEVWRRVERPSR